MDFLETLQSWIHDLSLPPLLIVGMVTLCSFYIGKSMKFIKLPSIIGFMVIGVFLGPSFFNILSEEVQHNFTFITEMALSFVAFSIGLELSLKSLKRQGKGIVPIIFAESFFAFILVGLGIFIFTGDLALALLFGAIAPASAPAGTVAVIQEYKAKGSLTNALYAVVGFDDGLGIIIFGFASAIAKNIITQQTKASTGNFLEMLLTPGKEIFLSLLVGIVIAVLFCLLARKLSQKRDIFILVFATVLISTGISIYFHLSLILTNMIIGIVIINTQHRNMVQNIKEELTAVMPLLFILFFSLAGANLHIWALPTLGITGLIYILCRTSGKILGASFGAFVGRAEKKLKKYIGIGILSQAGVAIGLSLIVKHEFAELGARGEEIGTIIITTVTATCIIFELIGPIFAKIALKKAGEIKE